MSRIHTLQMPLTEVARYFVADVAPEVSVPGEMVEGVRGVVIFEVNERRLIRQMRWGFPRLNVTENEAALIGLVADLTNPLWEGTVVDPRYRCIIPLTRFANPDGRPGKKTRTWFRVQDQPVMAWAGFCRNIPVTGPAYAGMTMEANAAIPPTNDRMPVLLDGPADWDRWLHGSIQDVISFQFGKPIAASRVEVMRTDDLWRSGIVPDDGQPTLL